MEPNSPYSASKAGSDLLARSYHRTHGLPVCITRCSNNYGPHQFPEKVIPLFVTNLLDGRKVPLYGDGLNVRDWLHVDDHCRGIQLVAEKGRDGETYNIGGGTELTNRELTYRLLAAVGADESMIEPVADRKGHDRRYSVDWSKIADELGYAPQTPFDRGLRRHGAAGTAPTAPGGSPSSPADPRSSHTRWQPCTRCSMCEVATRCAKSDRAEPVAEAGGYGGEVRQVGPRPADDGEVLGA